jgi:hypothetical protein
MAEVANLCITEPNTTTTSSNCTYLGFEWWPTYPHRPWSNHPWTIQYLPRPISVREIPDDELVAELKRRKRARSALDEIDIRDGKGA